MNVCIAEHSFLIELSGHAQRGFEPFLCDKVGEYVVSITPEDIELERQNFDGAASEEMLEYTAVHRKVCDRLIDSDVLLMHGSCIEKDGEGYLFAAVSGTGKSTHTKLWADCLGARWIDDDKPLLHIGETGATAYGTPWNGKHQRGCNGSVPLKAIIELQRGEENSIEPISPMEAFPSLFTQTYIPAGKEELALRLLKRLTEQVRFYRLRCNMEPEAAITAYNGMK